MGYIPLDRNQLIKRIPSQKSAESAKKLFGEAVADTLQENIGGKGTSEGSKRGRKITLGRPIMAEPSKAKKQKDTADRQESTNEQQEEGPLQNADTEVASSRNITVGQYVLINYEGSLFPGQVISTTEDGATVSTMI